jgi:hypothetical protein
MEKLSDKEWLALKRCSTAPLSEVWRDAIDIVLLQRPVSYTAEEVCAAYNKPKPKTTEKWKDELLKEFDTAAGTILEDAGCLHDDGLVCEICQPFADARKKYAEHINAPKSAEERVEIREESGDFPWVVYVDGHRTSGHGIRNERGHDEGAEGMRKRFVAALKESESSE